MRENGGASLVALVMILFSFLLYWTVWSLKELTKRPKVAKQRGPKLKVGSIR